MATQQVQHLHHRGKATSTIAASHDVSSSEAAAAAAATMMTIPPPIRSPPPSNTTTFLTSSSSFMMIPPGTTSTFAPATVFAATASTRPSNTLLVGNPPLHNRSQQQQEQHEKNEEKQQEEEEPGMGRSKKTNPVENNATGVINNHVSSSSSSSTATTGAVVTTVRKPAKPAVTAQVYRKKCGTGPFDRFWFNTGDVCGILCASLTYVLHMYGMFVVCNKLLPPWMSHTDNIPNSHNNHSIMSVWGRIHQLAFVLISSLALVSHFKTMTTDPGSVPPDAQPIIQQDEEPAQLQEEKQRKPQPHVLMCRRCRSFKPSRAHHCSICRRCIVKMDHHCPWVNNCVGLRNHKYFLLFVLYTSLSCLYALTLVSVRFTHCASIHKQSKYHQPPYHHIRNSNNQSIHHLRQQQQPQQLTQQQPQPQPQLLRKTSENTGTTPTPPRPIRNPSPYFTTTTTASSSFSTTTCMDQPADLLWVLGLFVESMLFGLFTCCMMCDQWSVLWSGLTHIDMLQQRHAKPLPHAATSAGIVEVFGIANRRWPIKTTKRRTTRIHSPPIYNNNNNNNAATTLICRRRRRRQSPAPASGSASTSAPVSGSDSGSARTQPNYHRLRLGLTHSQEQARWDDDDDDEEAEADDSYDGSLSLAKSSSPTSFRLDWINPFSAVYWGNMEDNIRGYCRPVYNNNSCKGIARDPMV